MVYATVNALTCISADTAYVRLAFYFSSVCAIYHTFTLTDNTADVRIGGCNGSIIHATDNRITFTRNTANVLCSADSTRNGAVFNRAVVCCRYSAHVLFTGYINVFKYEIFYNSTAVRIPEKSYSILFGSVYIKIGNLVTVSVKHTTEYSVRIAADRRPWAFLGKVDITRKLYVFILIVVSWIYRGSECNKLGKAFYEIRVLFGSRLFKACGYCNVRAAELTIRVKQRGVKLIFGYCRTRNDKAG